MKPAVAVFGTLAATAAALGLAWAQDNPNHESVGQHFMVVASNLPPPYATPASAERSVKAQPADPGRLELPPGFHANIFANGLTNARPSGAATIVFAPLRTSVSRHSAA